ncbi:MAG: hypothetical protein E6J14_15245 [Chloroflexi bacterium]|nr:MAG: hypothetical protein E6J14_15245 [Chloroflexota bacterium]
MNAAAMSLPIISPRDTRNALVIDSIPPSGVKAAELHLPYLLLPLPRRAILDLIAERLEVIVLWNPARVAQALEQEGFSVEFRSRAGTSPAMIVAWKDSDVEGRQLQGEVHDLDRHLREMIMELLPLTYLLDIVKAMRVAATAGFS